jgi:hypothetical protein
MDYSYNISNTHIFAEYAGSQPEVWRKLVGQQITHTALGAGEIIDVVFRGGQILFDVYFYSVRAGRPARRRLDRKDYDYYFKDLVLPPDLHGIDAVKERLQQQRERERQAEAEREARRIKQEAEQRAALIEQLKAAQRRAEEDTQHRTTQHQRSKYLNHCWNCQAPIDSDTNTRCDRCNLFICRRCGACFCGRSV